MAYKVKQSRYHYGKKKVVDDFVDLANAFRDALLQKPPFPRRTSVEASSTGRPTSRVRSSKWRNEHL